MAKHSKDSPRLQRNGRTAISPEENMAEKMPRTGKKTEKEDKMEFEACIY